MTRAILGGAVAVVLIAAPGLSAPEKPTIDPTKLVGKWAPMERKPGEVPTSMDFTKDGKVHIVADLLGQPIELDGTYTLMGDKLTLLISFGDNETPNSYTVLRLEGDRMELMDVKGVKQTVQRVKNKK